MNLSKSTLNEYLNKFYHLAELYLNETDPKRKDEFLNQLAGALWAGSNLGIFAYPDLRPSTCNSPIAALKTPSERADRSDPDSLYFEEALEEMKECLYDWLLPRSKKTLGIEGKLDAFVKAEAH